jgi:hypothetical protein
MNIWFDDNKVFEISDEELDAFLEAHPEVPVPERNR